MNNDHNKDIDDITGVETTGHSWDGLQELNNPLPRWWVWVFIITVIWSIWYFIVYPSWPVSGGATEGMSGYTQYKELSESQQEIFDRQAAYLERFETADFEKIMNDPELYAFAMAGGKSAFKDNCATCHGTGGEGGNGYPNLNDDDWLWGGQMQEIHQTLEHGIRAANLDTRMSQMPAFGQDKLLSKNEINAVIDYVLNLSGNKTDGNEKIGLQIFQQNCASCHGNDAKGDHAFGAPNLTDAIWLYGGDREDIYNTVYYSRGGMMPAWRSRLDANTIKQLTIYIHELGGGEVSDDMLPDEGLANDAQPESIQYEKTQDIELGDDVELPQPEHPAAKEMMQELKEGNEQGQTEK